MEFKKWLEEANYQKNIPFSNIKVIGDVHNFINEPGPKGWSYMDLVKSCNYSVQLGDMGGANKLGFSVGVNAGGYNYNALDKIDPKKHVFFGGNHDNYDALPAHHLGDYGTHSFPGFKFFYIRGAWSVNWRSAKIMNKIDKRWWPEEEIDESQIEPALKAYVQSKPEIVLSHDVPQSVLSIMKDNSKVKSYASNAGQMMAQRATSNIKNKGITPPSDEEIATPYLKSLEQGGESRTSSLLRRALDAWRPKIWIFGHHHTDWGQTINGTQFIGLGILSYMSF